MPTPTPNYSITSILSLKFHSFFILVIIFSNYPTNCYELTTAAIPKEIASDSEVPVVNSETVKNNFWDGYSGEEHVSKLSSLDYSQFISTHNDSFIMFYANWCSASKEAGQEFAKVAQEMAYTEGFTNIGFGALDCNGTEANKYICNKTYDVIKYPRFLYFKNGQFDRMYTTWCPRHSDFFYSWIVFGGSGKYCSGSGSGSGGVMQFMSSSSTTSPHRSTSSLSLYHLATCILVILASFL